MNSPFKQPAALCAALLATVLATPATAGITSLDRLSFVSMDGSGLGAPPGGPDAYEESTALTGTFDATLEDSVVNVEPGEATNSGSWTVHQQSTVDETNIDATLTQTATVATDFGSPGIFTRSRFLVTFTVDSTIDAELTGSITGSINHGAADYVQVLLKRDGVAQFNTGFGHVFPFNTTLEPGRTYELEVDVAGEVEFNGTVSSSAVATLTLDPFALDTDADGIVNGFDNCTTVANPAQTDGDGDGYGNACDPDFDDSCLVTIADALILRAGIPGVDTTLDLNEDGVVTFADFQVMRPFLFQAPGPSGLTDHCQ